MRHSGDTMHRAAGYTLVELMITLTVAGGAIMLGVPTYQDFVEKRHTESKSEQFASFLNHAQSEAVKRFDEVTLSVDWATDGWCAGATRGTVACDCTGTDGGAPDCAIDGVTQILASESSDRASMLDPVIAGNGPTFTYDPVRGIMSATANNSLALTHEFEFQSTNTHYKTEVAVLPTGRINICSSGDKLIPTFDKCPTGGGGR